MTFFGSSRHNGKLIIPIEGMKRVFEYHPNGWVITKIDRTNSPKGVRVGCTTPSGYEALAFEGRNYFTHRVIWALCTGEQPRVVDHINGDKQDNRIENLRSVTHRQNIINYYVAKRGMNIHEHG